MSEVINNQNMHMHYGTCPNVGFVKAPQSLPEYKYRMSDSEIRSIYEPIKKDAYVDYKKAKVKKKDPGPPTIIKLAIVASILTALYASRSEVLGMLKTFFKRKS